MGFVIVFHPKFNLVKAKKGLASSTLNSKPKFFETHLDHLETERWGKVLYRIEENIPAAYYFKGSLTTAEE